MHESITAISENANMEIDGRAGHALGYERNDAPGKVERVEISVEDDCGRTGASRRLINTKTIRCHRRAANHCGRHLYARRVMHGLNQCLNRQWRSEWCVALEVHNEIGFDVGRQHRLCTPLGSVAAIRRGHYDPRTELLRGIPNANIIGGDPNLVDAIYAVRGLPASQQQALRRARHTSQFCKGFPRKSCRPETCRYDDRDSAILTREFLAPDYAQHSGNPMTQDIVNVNKPDHLPADQVRQHKQRGDPGLRHSTKGIARQSAGYKGARLTAHCHDRGGIILYRTGHGHDRTFLFLGQHHTSIIAMRHANRSARPSS
ncbi:hypothetical protein HMPREF9718_03842 [Sphingobium yanoikuyae ATCC 51230]|uniref:Uncharacterized protein n=1 Tax=Sphingobium yanoikuyae ATCC 51230 TaxID=883163 RepID=K9CNE5_SPHYA|nr:hypothetical protein HMPREF9718_03842 [Sphingobium yanoikuyae ATCC 51230]